jgi:hypothetical protein
MSFTTTQEKIQYFPAHAPTKEEIYRQNRRHTNISSPKVDDFTVLTEVL